jgi:hypothetical protein
MIGHRGKIPLPVRRMWSRLVTLCRTYTLPMRRTFNLAFRRPRIATLREALEEDLDRVMALFDDARAADAASPDDARTQTLGVRLREAYFEAVKISTCYIVEVDGRIIAIGCVFPFEEFKRDSFELGSLYVVPDYEGFKIQAVLMPLGIATAIIQEKQDLEIYAGAKSGSKSTRGILKTGFKELEEPGPGPGKYCKSCEQQPPDYPDRCCVIYYKLPLEEQCRNIRLFLDSDRIVTYTHEDGRRLTVQKIIALSLPGYREALRNWHRSRCPDAVRPPAVAN